MKAFPAIAALLTALSLAAPARAAMISNLVSVFAALDKVTGRVPRLNFRMGQTITFGALRITARACYTNPPTETPETAAFIEVDGFCWMGRRGGFSQARPLPRAPAFTRSTPNL